MRETNLDCCVVRDLLPSYLEELTETETSAMVREHIEHCAACRQLEEDMRRQVPIEKAPQRAITAIPIRIESNQQRKTRRQYHEEKWRQKREGQQHPEQKGNEP